MNQPKPSMNRIQALELLYEAAYRLQNTAVVDDDFPKVMHEFEGALRAVESTTRRKIVCLCGSTKFKQEYLKANLKETLAGKIVLSVGGFPHTDNESSPEDLFGQKVKDGLDDLHLEKIDLADEVYVLNVGGYVGKSTRREIAHAKGTNTPIRWLEPELTEEIKR